MNEAIEQAKENLYVLCVNVLHIGDRIPLYVLAGEMTKHGLRLSPFFIKTQTGEMVWPAFQIITLLGHEFSMDKSQPSFFVTSYDPIAEETLARDLGLALFGREDKFILFKIHS